MALRGGLSFINTHPKLQRYFLAIIRMVGLHPLARAIYARMIPASSQANKNTLYGFIPTDIAQLSPHARQIYADLKAAIERRQKGDG